MFKENKKIAFYGVIAVAAIAVLGLSLWALKTQRSLRQRAAIGNVTIALERVDSGALAVDSVFDVNVVIKNVPSDKKISGFENLAINYDGVVFQNVSDTPFTFSNSFRCFNRANFNSAAQTIVLRAFHTDICGTGVVNLPSGNVIVGTLRLKVKAAGANKTIVFNTTNGVPVIYGLNPNQEDVVYSAVTQGLSLTIGTGATVSPTAGAATPTAGAATPTSPAATATQPAATATRPAATATGTQPAATPTWKPCSFCDFNGDGKICLGDKGDLMNCVATRQFTSCGDITDMSIFDMNGNGVFDESDSARCNTCPTGSGCPTNAPNGLQRSCTQTSMTLSWNQVRNATGYKLLVCAQGLTSASGTCSGYTTHTLTGQTNTSRTFILGQATGGQTIQAGRYYPWRVVAVVAGVDGDAGTPSGAAMCSGQAPTVSPTPTLAQPVCGYFTAVQTNTGLGNSARIEAEFSFGGNNRATDKLEAGCKYRPIGTTTWTDIRVVRPDVYGQIIFKGNGTDFSEPIKCGTSTTEPVPVGGYDVKGWIRVYRDTDTATTYKECWDQVTITAPTATPRPGTTTTPVATATQPAACPRGDLGNLNCGQDGRGGEINITDLTMMLDKFGTNGVFPATSGFHSANIVTTNNVVDISDLTKLLDNWGTGQ